MLDDEAGDETSEVTEAKQFVKQEIDEYSDDLDLES